jgi:hypothetical protein
MSDQSDQINGMIQDEIGSYEVERHFGDIAPVYSPAVSDTPLNAVQAKARGAADRMWQKVKEDLEQLDQLDEAETDSRR